MEAEILEDIASIFVLSATMLLIATRLRFPSIVAFLIAGMLAGPYGLRVVMDMAHVDLLATIGVVLLLFTIGMEFSFRKLAAMKEIFFLGGAIQVLGTGLAGFLLAYAIGRGVAESLFLGGLLSLSSTAIVMKSLEQRHEAESPHGKLVLGIAIFQDVISVPMLLGIPLLVGGNINIEPSLLIAIAKGALIIGLTFVFSEYLVPKLMFRVAQTKRRELFLLTIFAICFSVAWVTTLVGLPISLGAFLAGLTVSGSEYRHQALGDILPFQDIFTCFFFVSIGMLLDVQFVWNQPLLIFSLTLGVLALKTAIATLSGVALRMPLRSALIGGLFLSQVGEFSFILAQAGKAVGLGSDYLYQMFLAVSLFSMAISPYLINQSSRIANFFQALKLPERLVLGKPPKKQEKAADLKGHVVIAGFGVSGRNVALSCKSAAIPYLTLEMSAEIVRKERRKGEPIFFGDASHPSILHMVHIEDAKAMVVAINDPAATRRITEEVRKQNPHCFLIVRTRFLQDLPTLYKLGADEVIADEFETSVELFTRVLNRYLVPQEEIDSFVSSVRATEYAQLRAHQAPHIPSFSDLQLHASGLAIETIRVAPESSLAHLNIEQSKLKSHFGLTVLLLIRNQEPITQVQAGTKIEAGDLLVLFGDAKDLQRVKKGL